MQRRSFLAAIAALPVFGLFKKAPRDLSMWTDYPVKLTEPVWIDPFIEVNLDNGSVIIGDVTFDTNVLRSNPKTIQKMREVLAAGEGTISLIWGPDDECRDYVRVSYSNSFDHIIPVEAKDFDKWEFYTEIKRNAPDQRLEFYHIAYKGKHNLFVRTFETTRRDNLVISKEAMEDILNWTPRS